MLENRRTRAALADAIEAARSRSWRRPRSADVAFEAAGATREPGGRPDAARALVVGAEGRGSRAAARRPGSARSAGAMARAGWSPPSRSNTPHQGVAHEYFLPSGPFAILPLTDNRASLVWTEKTAAAEALRTARPEVVLSLLRRRFGDFLGAVEVVGPTFVYPLSLQLAERLMAPRLALLGDAAHGIHPIAGQGLNLGLKDAAVLAEVLADARAAGRGHRLGGRAGALCAPGAGSTTSTLAAAHGRCSTACSPTTSRPCALVAGPRHGRGQPHRPGAALLHARGGRRGRRPAPAVQR